MNINTKKNKSFAIVFILVIGFASANASEPPFKVSIIGSAQETLGVVNVRAVPQGVLLLAEFDKLSPGPHAFHIHEFGVCEGSFKSSGGHFNPEGEKMAF